MGLCAGCAGNPTLPNALVLDQQLIDGSAVFGYVVPAAQPVDMLAMTPAMRAFVDEDVGQSQYSYRRFERLLKKMEVEGFFRNPYLQTGTYTAAETRPINWFLVPPPGMCSLGTCCAITT